MRMRYFGDSYDIVKQSILRWLRDFGTWSVHPMFTEPVLPTHASAFESFLGATLVSTDVLTCATNRPAYFSCASSCGNLFLDPDTGLRTRATRGVRAPTYLFLDELLMLTEQRPNSLTVVFDQSLGRGSEQAHLACKLEELRRRDRFAFAYMSHACFIVTSPDRGLTNRARRRILDQSRLPEHRFVPSSANEIL